MSLAAALLAREHDPVRVGVIGAGTFGRMFLAQARRTPGLRITAIVDRDPERARAGLREAGWTDPPVTDELAAALEDTEVVIEATGDPGAGVTHALAAIEARRHLVMVNVEADALVGPLLARRARPRASSTRSPPAISRR